MKKENRKMKKKIIDGVTYYFPILVNRSRCFSFHLSEGCLYCSNKTFRYYSTSCGKKYYQCEKCCGINH